MSSVRSLRTAAAVALLATAALVGALAPQAVAAQSAPSVPSVRHTLPLPPPVLSGDPLVGVGEGVSIEGPLLNGITLPTLR